MTDPEILERAMEIAEEHNEDIAWEEICPSLDEPGTVDCSLTGFYWLVRHAIVFNHEFAKAFWPDKPEWDEGDRWQYHLMAMAVADEPIEYLRKFVEAK